MVSLPVRSAMVHPPPGGAHAASRSYPRPLPHSEHPHRDQSARQPSHQAHPRARAPSHEEEKAGWQRAGDHRVSPITYVLLATVSTFDTVTSMRSSGHHDDSTRPDLNATIPSYLRRSQNDARRAARRSLRRTTVTTCHPSRANCGTGRPTCAVEAPICLTSS